ncbi:MAG TPA: hypothetical protein VK588_10220, partial [Chitinophagaceae bacterium]|nr:hypothetical protein [Chitinophagaceae bacterium]
GVLLNIDSLQLFNFYEQNPESRTTAIRYYESHAKQLTDLVNSLDSNHASQIKADSIIKTAKAFLDSADKLKIAASLPVGFENSIFKKQLGDLPGAAKHKLFYLWLLKILGILVSGFAASFGAPFWFDLLRKAYTQKA